MSSGCAATTRARCQSSGMGSGGMPGSLLRQDGGRWGRQDGRMVDDADLAHLRRCVALARAALESGDEPFGSVLVDAGGRVRFRSEEHTSEPSHANISYAVFCLKKKTNNQDRPTFVVKHTM